MLKGKNGGGVGVGGVHSALPHGMLVEEVYFVSCGVSVCLQLPQGAMRGLGKDFPQPQAWQRHQWMASGRDPQRAQRRAWWPYRMGLPVPTLSPGSNTGDFPVSQPEA